VNKLREAKRLVRSAKTKADLKALGFRQTRVFNSTVDFIYIHHELQAVVKESWIVGERPPRRLRIPTERFFCPAFNRLVILQPFADTREGGRALDLLRVSYLSADPKSSNAAWFDGKPVYIDW